MSTIKPKIGICIDCGEDSQQQILTAGRCNTHYWRYRTAVSIERANARDIGKDRPDKDNVKALDNWFAARITEMERHCENCGEYLNPYAPWGAKSYIAHIVPKRNFVSVMVHPLNRVFLCIQCHTNYDNWGADKVIAMPVFDVLMERFKIIAPSIAFEELRYLPGYFADVVNV